MILPLPQSSVVSVCLPIYHDEAPQSQGALAAYKNPFYYLQQWVPGLLAQHQIQFIQIGCCLILVKNVETQKVREAKAKHVLQVR